MLNLFKLNTSSKEVKNTQKVNRKSMKHFPSSIREWKNSIYVYNSNALKLIPSSSLEIIKLIKSYFNLFNNILEKKIRTKRLLLRYKRLSSNKIYINNGEFKHSNNKVLITLYIFNRQKYNYSMFLQKMYLKSFFKKQFNNNLIKLLKQINNKSAILIKKTNNNKYFIIKALKSINNKHKYIYTNDYINNFYKILIKKSLRRIYLYYYYKQLLYINNSKFNYTYLQNLFKHLEKVFNKNIEFNIINLKRFYLNSDILFESVALKIKKNRGKILKFLNTIKNKIRTQKSYISSMLIKEHSNIKYYTNNEKELKRKIIKDLKYRHVTGFRLEARGRLTRRYTASRSVSKLRYKGNLLNVDSSYKGISSVLLRGNLKSNIQFTKLNSKSRIGSFGLKGWISGN
jgi:hypothetical protein